MARAPIPILAAALALLAAGCAVLAPERSSPLVGRIWQVDAGRFASEESLLRALAQARYVLLGEVHDNPEHHRIQARIVGALAARGRRPSVVFEMISRDRAEALARALRDPEVDAESLRQTLEWDTSGWPAWPLYAPVFEAALQWRLPLAAGDLSSADRDALRRAGARGLPPEAVARLALSSPLPAPQREALSRAIREGHCDLLPEDAVTAMVELQRARDAELARSLVGAATRDGAILIAGAGHVRRDAGVPHWLARFDPGAGVAALALLEAEADDSDPSRALAEHYGEPIPFDQLWFTAPAPREDPCEKLRRRLAGRADG
jgi:uncharacterized iron-regulated protein